MEIRRVWFHCANVQVFLLLSKLDSGNFLVSEAPRKYNEKVSFVMRGVFWIIYNQKERPLSVMTRFVVFAIWCFTFIIWKKFIFIYLFTYYLTFLAACLFAHLLTLLTNFITNSIYKEMLLRLTTNFSKTALRKLHKFCQGASLITNFVKNWQKVVKNLTTFFLVTLVIRLSIS